jgi:hypothetical protein
MFCPVCKAEYREGFYRCADCDVLLVDSLPAPPTEAASPPSSNPSAVILWRGHDPVVFTAILSALEDARIAYLDAATQDPEGDLGSGFPMGLRAAPGFAIRVDRADLAAARECVKAVIERLSADATAASELEIPYESAEEGGSELPEHWNPEEAAREVWCGDDEAAAEFMEATLRENGIPCRRLTEANSPVRLFIRPQDEARARKIIREVTEGTPPAPV